MKSFYRTRISDKLTSKIVSKLKTQEQLTEEGGSKKENKTRVFQRQKIGSTGKIIKIQKENSHQLPKIEENNTYVDAPVEKENKSPAEVMINEPAKAWFEKKEDAPSEETPANKHRKNM